MAWKKRDPAIDLELTDRQQEVLTLIAKGRTNPEIAAELGITLDGAKWHVREILSKLGVDSRDEAAAYWRQHRMPGRRLARAMRGLTGPSLKWAVAAGASAGVLAVFIVVVVALSGGESPQGSVVPTETGTASPTAAVTPTSGPSPTGAPPTPSASPDLIMLPGMFVEPRPTRVPDIELTAPPEPDPTFEWDGESTMIYDRQTGRLIDLGPGEPAAFSPDGEWAAWVSGNRFEGDLHAINLRTGERRDLGEGGYVSHFVDNDRFIVDFQATEGFLVSVATGAREPIVERPALVTQLLGPLRLTSEQVGEYHERWTLRDETRGDVLVFDAYSALLIDASRLLVVTEPVSGAANLFVVDVASGAAEYVATAEFPGHQWYFGPMGPSTIAWTSDLCSDEPATWILDLPTRELSYVPGLYPPWPAADGLLGVGSTGLERLIDSDTFEYVFVSPAGWPHWSDDLRYVSVGYVGGHGGYVCN